MMYLSQLPENIQESVIKVKCFLMNAFYIAEPQQGARKLSSSPEATSCIKQQAFVPELVSSLLLFQTTWK